MVGARPARHLDATADVARFPYMGKKSWWASLIHRSRSRSRLLAGAAVGLLCTGLAQGAVADGERADGERFSALGPNAARALAWRDDFNTLSSATWRVIDRDCYDPGNVAIANGRLRMTIAPTSRRDCPGVTGARINTYGLREWTSGTFSARIKFVLAPGSWQTFWMTGANGSQFPANGEVDIAEVIGRTPQNTHVALHSAFKAGGTKRCDVGGAPPATLDRVWHTYSATTSGAFVEFKIDGVRIARYTPGGTCTWPFGDPMRILFSSRGGQYGGDVDVTKYPVSYLVDWVSWTPL
jgi:beta-glucanase (GH16 family)